MSSILEYADYILGSVREGQEWWKIKGGLRIEKGYEVVPGDCLKVRVLCKEKGIKLSMARPIGTSPIDYYIVNGNL